jgi:hypothetical protein
MVEEFFYHGRSVFLPLLPLDPLPCFARKLRSMSQPSEPVITRNSQLDTLLNERDLARITGLSVASVRRWRLTKGGPTYLKIGASVRYQPRDVAAWLDRQRRVESEICGRRCDARGPNVRQSTGGCHFIHRSTTKSDAKRVAEDSPATRTEDCRGNRRITDVVAQTRDRRTRRRMMSKQGSAQMRSDFRREDSLVELDAALNRRVIDAITEAELKHRTVRLVCGP